MGKAIKTMLLALALVGTTLAISTQRLWAGNWQSNSDGTFISTQMFVSIMNGWNAASVWTNRGDVAMSSAMVPQGDGSFLLRADLVPTAQYNYLFFFGGSTNTGGNFGVGNMYGEPVPNNGNDMGTYLAISTGANGSPIWTVVCSSPNTTLGYGTARGDGRRLIQMPDVNPGTTVYIYNHFGSTMNGVANTNVTVTPSAVYLSWNGGLGYWGNGTGNPALLGGGVSIYVSSGNNTCIANASCGGLSGPYTFLANLSGQTTTFNFGAPASYTGGGSSVPVAGPYQLTQGTSYFFVFVTSDTYTGTRNPTAFTPFPNFTREAQFMTSTGTYPASLWASNAMNFQRNDLQGKPNALTPVWFKVQKPDLDYIKQHGNMVFLTPGNVNDPAYPHKIQATLAVGYVPKKAD